MSWFQIGKSGEGKSSDGFKRDPRKARRFFEHAEAVADTRNYDYAIECYINGLRHDPDNMTKHEALHDVALKRKVGGGKPAGLGVKLKGVGPTATDKMLQAEKLWSMDPLNVKLMHDMMKHAVEADEKHGEEQEQVNLAEVAYWVGSMLLESIASAKRPDKNLYLKARDLFVQITAYDKAVDACRRALALDPNSANLMQDLKNLEAELTMKEGGYADQQTVEEGGYQKFVRDAEKQQELDQTDRVRRTGTAADQIIARRRAEHEEDPQDLDRLQKLVNVLIQRETNESETEAITLLRQAWDQTGQYRYKMRIGDIKIKQINRIIRPLAAKLKANPNHAETRQRWNEARGRQLAFELQEYTERVKNYPTDMALRFEVGKRLYQAGKVDEAIGAFQQAKADPKHRAVANLYLGQCYLKQKWYEEAIDTLHKGIEGYRLSDDKLALDMRYTLMDALEASGQKNHSAEQTREAQKIGSQILQTDINFRNIKDRMDKIRRQVEKLEER